MLTPFPPNKSAKGHYTCISRIASLDIPFLCCNCKGHNCVVSKHSSICSNMFKADLIKPSPEPYVPQVGDRILIEGVVDSIDCIDSINGTRVYVLLDGNERKRTLLFGTEVKHAKLISRPTPKLKLTRKEIEEKVGGEFEIINEE